MEYVPLKQVCEISKGVQFNRINMKERGTYPVINGGMKPSGYIEQYNREGGSVTVAQGGAAGFVSWQDKQFWAGAHCYVIEPSDKVTSRYMYHVLKSREWDIQKQKYGTTIMALPKSALEELIIPVPPLEVQCEVVRKLDKFTELVSLLVRELEARRKQYEYYRDKLLTFGDDVRCQKLTEVISKLVDGMHLLPKGLTSSGKYPVISAQNVSGGTISMHSQRYADDEIFTKENARTRVTRGDVLLTIVGTIGRTAVVPDERKMLFQRSVCIMTPNPEKILSGFLRYTLDSSVIQKWMQKNARGGAQKGLYLNQISQLTIPVPTLETQHQIVGILDKFTDLMSLLELEITARKKQYAYYRDKLLDFKSAHIIQP